MKAGRIIILLILLVDAAAGAAAAERDPAQPTADFTRAESFEANPGGAATHHKNVNSDSFSHPSANMSFKRELDFRIGNGFFKRLWVSAPSSTQAADGLGPLYNARSCQGCHLKDGRGHPPAGPDDTAVSMFLRLSIPPRNDEDRRRLDEHRANVIPEPTYGGQLQNFAIQGLQPEGYMQIEYREIPVALADGTVVMLRQPSYSIADPGYGPPHPDTMLSPRIAPPMIGLGLLELIDEQDILAGADPDDRDGDGISGRTNRVWSREHQRVMLGRFGWKAGAPSVNEQAEAAFNGDIGISTPLFPDGAGDCTVNQKLCIEAPNGNSPQYENLEAPGEVVDLVSFYSRNLAVPARRDYDDTEVLAGKKIFYESGCIACHRPKFITRTDAGFPEQSHQLIWPYTDLLLHDMGNGLADGRQEGAATGSEWRTPPLWGIGLTETVSGHTLFLHDGRARSLLEAILWHDGEARHSRDAVVSMPAEDRQRLILFLESL